MRPLPSPCPADRSAPCAAGSSARRLAERAAVALVAVLGALGVAATGASAQTAPAPKPPHVIATSSQGIVTRLGPVRVNTRRSSLSNAYRSFGRPTSTSGRGNVRRVRWKAAGVSIVAVTFGGCRRTTCRTSELRVQTARVTGPRWQTAAGLRVGEPAARIPELYPRRRAPSDGSGDVVLSTAASPFGESDDVPIVTARVRGGVVTGFDVFVGSAGD